MKSNSGHERPVARLGRAFSFRTSLWCTGGFQLPLGIRARIQGGDLCCEAIFFDESEKPKSGIVSGAFHTPREAASALLDKIYEIAE